MLDLPTPLAVVCHDAGAANLVLAWLAADETRPRALMCGPAKHLWAERFGDAPTLDEIAQALDGAAALLSGTGWASDLEHEARREARARGLRSVAVIDHWVNYPQRFQRHGETVWPDEFWVTDEDALAEARRCFPEATIRLQPNLWLREQLARIAPPPAATRAPEVLYLLEPARDDWGRGTPGEFQALDYFIEECGTLGLGDATLVLRPHPSDPPGKYDAWLARHGSRACLDVSRSLAEAIGRCAWVAGMESNAMVVALAARRRVVCTLPPWAPPCRLPQRGLIHLKERIAR